MRPTIWSECNRCRRLLEHNEEPSTLLCWMCKSDLHEALPPPTTEYRNTVQITYRPLMLLMVAAVFSAGFIVGFLARG